MTSKRCLSKSSSPEQTNTYTIATQPESSSKPNLCLICGDKAHIINYGALSCQSCKTFFRRNGFRPEIVRPCTINKCCRVNMQTRHNCTACRLAKCFTMGMSSNFIRKEDYKKLKTSPSTKSNNTEHVISKQITNTPQLPTLDLIRNDRSHLLHSQWALLSNVLHAYDTYSIVSQVRHATDNLTTLPVELHLYMINPLEIVSQMFKSIQSFISSSPDFRILTINEQSSLCERNLHGIVGFYSTLFFRSSNILHNDQYMEAFTSIYGSEMMLLSRKANDQLDPDSTLIKLILIIFAFSSNCFLANQHKNMKRDNLLYGTFRLLGSQNVYLEILWKYMVYRYGYHESVRRFSRFIQIFLCVLKNLAIIYTHNEAHHNMVDDVIEHTKKSLIINENEHTPLWGKT